LNLYRTPAPYPGLGVVSRAPGRQTHGGRDASARVPPVDYRDELRRCSHEPLPQQADSLPQPPTVVPFFRG